MSVLAAGVAANKSLKEICMRAEAEGAESGATRAMVTAMVPGWQYSSRKFALQLLRCKNVYSEIIKHFF